MVDLVDKAFLVGLMDTAFLAGSGKVALIDH